MVTKAKILEKLTSITETNINDFVNQLHSEMSKDFSGIIKEKTGVTDYCPTGSAAFDFALSNKIVGGGWPIGKLHELYGNNSTGKSMLGFLALANCLNGKIYVSNLDKKIPGTALLVDTEHAYNPKFFEQLGGNPDLLLVADHATKAKDKERKPLTIESSYEIIINFMQKARSINKDIPIVIVWDSIAATPSDFEISHEIQKADYGKRAIAHGKGMRLLPDKCRAFNATVILINQLRATMAQYGPDKDSVGGSAIKYNCSTRTLMKKGKLFFEKVDGSISQVGAKTNAAGINCRVLNEKTRFTPPFREVSFDLFFREGVKTWSGYQDAIINFYRDTGGIIKKENARTYTYKNEIKFTKKDFVEKVMLTQKEFSETYSLDDLNSFPEIIMKEDLTEQAEYNDEADANIADDDDE